MYEDAILMEADTAVDGFERRKERCYGGSTLF